MVSPVNNIYPGAIQSYTNAITATKLSEGTCLQAATEGNLTAGQAAQYDKLELSQDQCQVTLDVPDEITIGVPRAWTIMGETAKSFHDHLQWSLEEADRQNLSFGDRLTFLREQTGKWVEHKRQNDPEMFASWLSIGKHHIQEGKPELIGLPADFTMSDYYSYVKKPFSTLV